MEEIPNIPTRRKLIIVLSVILGGLFLSLITLFFLLHSYINKMNLVTNAETTDTETLDESALATEEEVIAPDADPNIPEVSEQEIVTLEEELQKNLEENSTPIRYDKDVFNVLLIGSDTRKSGGNGRSDAMILISINKKGKTITVTSFLRDIYLQIPGKINGNRLNAAYAFGGADLLMDTMEQNFKVQVDRYASIDFYAFIDVVDAVGGVTLDVTNKEIPIINNYIKEINRLTGKPEDTDCLTQPGTLLLNGKQALGYTRNRYIGTDFERTARQRRVLEQIFTKVKKLDFAKLSNLLKIILPEVTTNLKEGEILTLLLSLPSYINYNLDQWSIPMKGSYTSIKVRGMDVLEINFDENVVELQRRVYGATGQ
jgi:polyisoprenyl-teichoic acid--peptidoglycan teichoic acid transferase